MLMYHSHKARHVGDPAASEQPLCTPRSQVPNIRFNVAKMLERLMPLLEAQVMDQTVRPVLQELKEDSDTDVRFYAGQALAACDNRMVS